jgi:hypothetical protein
MDVCLRLFCVCVCGLATGWSPVQGVLPTVLRLRNWSETKRFTDALCSKVGATVKREKEIESLGRHMKNIQNTQWKLSSLLWTNSGTFTVNKTVKRRTTFLCSCINLNHKTEQAGTDVTYIRHLFLSIPARPSVIPPKFPVVFHSPPDKCWYSTSIIPWQLSSISFPIHQSSYH